MNDQSLAQFGTHADWLNPPPTWSIDETGVLQARSGDKTDFWRKTHYGFVRDDGHAVQVPCGAEFTASLTFSGTYETLYDQAGLIIRANERHWVKFGVEFTDGVPNLSCVVTHDVSDWSARPAPEALTGPITIRATRLGDALLLQAQVEGSWQMERLAPWPTALMDAKVGPYLCSPERAGLEAQFLNFKLTDPQVRTLHAE